MGEYAFTRSGERIKIGTCESMYYLRADQVPQLQSSDIGDHWDQVRFRFPFPDEDNVRPGAFEPFERAYRVDGVDVDRSQFTHYNIQFRAESHGYLLSVPCPEANGTDDNGMSVMVGGLKVARNGFRGSTFLVQQRIWAGKLVAVFQCACGAAYRVETLEQVEPYLVALRSKADREQRELDMAGNRDGKDYGTSHSATVLHEIADRITAGYVEPPAWVVDFTSSKAGAR